MYSSRWNPALIHDEVQFRNAVDHNRRAWAPPKPTTRADIDRANQQGWRAEKVCTGRRTDKWRRSEQGTRDGVIALLDDGEEDTVPHSACPWKKVAVVVIGGDESSDADFGSTKEGDTTKRVMEEKDAKED